MKKIALLLLSLTLIIGCLVAFSSCGECKHEYDDEAIEITLAATCTTDGECEKTCVKCGETITEVIPALDHAWATTKTVDKAATCISKGSESYHCTRQGCKVKNDVTEIAVKPDAHDIATWEITAEPNVFGNGSKEGTCSICEQLITEVISNDECIVIACQNEVDPVEPNKDYTEILAEGQHFYPTADNANGNDLFIEFSILWNEYAKQGPDVIGFRLWGHKGDNNVTIMQLNLKDNISGQWGTFAGSIEPCNITDYTEDSPNKGKSGSTIDNTDIAQRLPGLVGYGWHRLGIQIHQDAYIEAGEVKYTVVMSVYIDGELGVKYGLKTETDGGLIKKGGLLYTATANGEELVYADNTNGFGPYIYIEKFANCENFYLPIGDISFTAGHDFAYKVEKLTTPAGADNTFAVDTGKTVSAKQFYKYK